MRSADDLRSLLRRIDGRSYGAYKDLRGSYDLGDGVILSIDHVQGDPFAAPSTVRCYVPASRAGLPPALRDNPIRRLALEDFLARRMRRALPGERGGRGSGKSGLMSIDAGGQEVLERTAAVVEDDGAIEVRLQVGLPAAGRRVLSREADAMLTRDLPRALDEALAWRGHAPDGAREFVDAVENQEYVRAQLDTLGLVAFVADGARLPRESGASDRPMAASKCVPVRAPDALRVEVEVPHGPDGPDIAGCWSGLGIPRGITLVVGGGYHGKSTLLRALERGVYAHVPGDGREAVVTVADAVKIRAEDGRRVEAVDVSPFIGQLPYGRPTKSFSSDAASGSTSQAANIVEALEAGTTCLLVDEDTSATNFMVRDARMQALVHSRDEPITPLVDRIRELYEVHGVSSVVVVGGCGDYFDVADTVIRMRDYLPEDASVQAAGVPGGHPTGRVTEAAAPLPPTVTARVPDGRSFDASRGRRDVKISARSVDEIVFGTQTIDLRAVEQLVDVSQTRAIGRALHLAAERFMDGRRTLGEVLEALERLLRVDGLEALTPDGEQGRHPGNLAMPRRHEIACAINRLRTFRVHLPT